MGMTPILRKGDKIHFTVPIGTTAPGRVVGAEDVVEARKDAARFEENFRNMGIQVLGWSANTGICALQINFIIREEPDA